MQAPVRQSRMRVSIFIFLYSGYRAGMVMSTVVAVVPSRWAMVAMRAVATVTAMTLLPASLTSLPMWPTSTTSSKWDAAAISIVSPMKFEVLTTGIFYRAGIFSWR